MSMSLNSPPALPSTIPALPVEWKTAYKHGTAMQAPLIIIGFVLGVPACWETSDRRWLVGAVVLALNWPYTFFVIMPTNRQILGADSAHAGPNSRALVQNCGMLHAVRTL